MRARRASARTRRSCWSRRSSFARRLRAPPGERRDHRLALEPVALLDLRALTPLLELGFGPAELVIPFGDIRLARGELLLAPRQIGLHPLDLLGLPGTGAPVLHRREPAALRPKSPERRPRRRSRRASLRSTCSSSRSRTAIAGARVAQHLLQLFDLLVGPRLVLTRAREPLRHRASNVHALCRGSATGIRSGRSGGDRARHSRGRSRRARRGRSGLGRKRGRDPDQLRPVHEPVEPAPDTGRARLVRLRQHRRRHLPDRAVQRRRRLEQHRLGDDDERGPHMDDRHAARDDGLPGRALVADQRPGGRLRPVARRLDDLDARVRDGPAPFGSPTGILVEPLDRRRPDLGATRSDLRRRDSTTRTGSRATRGRRARTTATATTEWDDVGGWNGDLHEHVDRRRPHVERARLRPADSNRPRRASPSCSRTGPSSCRTRRQRDQGRSARPTAAPTGRASSRSATSPTTPSPGTSARRRSPRPRSTPRARSTSSGRTAASAAAAARTTS